MYDLGARRMLRDMTTTEPMPLDATDGVLPKIQPRAATKLSRYRRAIIGGGIIVAALIVYFGFGALVAYTDDAYIQSDLVAIAPEVAGFIQSVEIHDNQQVKIGDLLAKIDPEPYQLDVDLKQQKVASLTAAVAVKSQSRDADAANLDAARAALDLAQRDFERAKALSGEQYMSQAAFDKASDVLKTAQDNRTMRQARMQVNDREVTAAQAQVAVAEAELALAQYSLARTRLTAPVNGYVNNLTLRPGAYVRIGEAAIGIVDSSRWRVVANFKEDVAASLVPGTHVWVYLDSDPWHLWPGKVQGVGRGIAREPVASGLLPYIAPTTDWIRLRRRLAVTILLDPPLPWDALYMGADARVILWR
jgi:membrane fusion protein, multidrug efflux system